MNSFMDHVFEEEMSLGVGGRVSFDTRNITIVTVVLGRKTVSRNLFNGHFIAM